MKWLSLIFISFIFYGNVYAQDFPRKAINPSSLVDEIFATQDLDINYQDLYENYLQLISNPLNLNLISKEQLESLYVLTPQQVQSILIYQKESGPILSVYELQTVAGISRDIFLRIIPFITVNDPSLSFTHLLFKRMITEKNNYLLLRYAQTLEQQKGYLQSSDRGNGYAGGPGNFYARFRSSRSGDFSVGFTLEKDAGEKITWNPSSKYYGFDYLSFHLQALHKGKLKNLIIGDYQAQFGQGIALGSVFGIGKNAEPVTTIRRSNLGFLPYTSIYEAGYFRGAALSYEPTKNVTIHAMASTRGRDGNLQDTVQRAVSSFNFSGLHRTPTELANRNVLQETNLGLVTEYKNQSFTIGALLHTTQFNVSLTRQPNAYNQFLFNGMGNTNLGAFLNYSTNNATFFSEIVQSLQHGTAALGGVLISLTPQLEASFLYRKYDRDFYSFYSNALAENSVPQNESGLYWGWKYTFNKKYSIAGYVDLFQFPWLKYRSYSPSEGSEWLLRFNYRPTKTVFIFVQAREEIKQRNTGADVNLYLTDVGTRRNYWINVDYAATPKLSFKSRAQFSTYQLGAKTTQGMAVMQDATLDWNRFSFSGRFVLFDTDDYDNRLYAYEQDVLLAFTFPAYNGRGVRHFLMMQYRLTEKIDCWIRWSKTRYTDRDTIGSGGETIVGNTQNDVRFQVRIRF
jgi:hypothetical protein